MRLRIPIARSLADEDGIAIIVATMVLFILGVFAAVVASTATSLSDSAVSDRHSKRALAAAEAGLRYVAYLRTEQPDPLCTTPLGTTPVTQIPGSPQGGAYCAPHSKDLGNGTRFEAAASTELGTNGTTLNDCAGLALDARALPLGAGSIPFRQECIVSYGFSGDVVRRAQTRIAALREDQIFRVGLTGRERTCIASPDAPCVMPGRGSGRSIVLSDIGSDKYINTGVAETCGILYTSTGLSSGGDCERVFPTAGLPACGPESTGVPSCTLSTYRCGNPGDPDPTAPCAPGRETAAVQSVREVLPFFRSYKETRCVAHTDRAACLADSSLLTGDTKATNDNSTLNAQVEAVCGAGTYYPATGPDPRVLDLTTCTGGKTLRLSPGTYNLCGILFPGNLRFGASTTASRNNPVMIMLDSIYRATDRDSGTVAAESDCGSTSYDFLQGNNSALVSPDPLALQIYAYGNPACTATDLACVHKLHLQNSGRLAVGIFAPDSQLLIENSGTTGGGGEISNDCLSDADTANDACEMNGAFYSRWLDVGRGFEFTEDARFRTLVGPSGNVGFNRSAWRECPPSVPAGGNLASGC